MIYTNTNEYADPARTTLEVEGYKVNFRGEESPITMTPDDEDLTENIIWRFPLDADGHYRFYVTHSTDELTDNRVVSILTADRRDQAAIDGSVEQDLDSQRNRDVNRFRLLDIFTEGLLAADEFGEYNQGERIARRAEAL